MNRPRSLLPAVLSGLLAWLPLSEGGACSAQSPPCDSLQAQISALPDTSAYGQVLDVTLPPSVAPVGPVYWYFDDGSFLAGFGGQLVHQFPGAGLFPVCASLQVVDNQLLDTCSLFLCDLVEVVDPGCQGVDAEFTVALSGDTVLFIDLTTTGPGSSVTGWSWDLGDGTLTSGPAPQHTYATPGPHEVCLTVTALDSLLQPCTSTICHWFYSGPVDPPCEDLLAPSFSWLVLSDGQVVLWNTSMTSGMPGVVGWDLGDGNLASGPVVLHAYPFAGSFQACLNITVSGPLLTDSCTATACAWIDLTGVLGIAPLQEDGPLVFGPNPATDHITVDLPTGTGGGVLTITDLLGRPFVEMRLPAGRHQVPLVGIPAGVHMLVWRSAGTRRTSRLVVAHGP